MDRVLLSHANLFGAPRAVLRKGRLYPKGPERVAQLGTLFAHYETELFMAVRNPASFLSACLRKSPQGTMASFLAGADPRAVRWSETLLRIRNAAPHVPITVWCSEDAPLVWGQVLREMAGLENGEHVAGSYDLLGEIMSRQGMARFVSYLKSKPHMTEVQIRQAMVAFLDKFAIDHVIEEEIDLPGWTVELVDELTEIYDEDVVAIERIPGVRLICP